MDPSTPEAALLTLRLPRLRGDGPIESAQIFRQVGVAPPTRGWTLSSLSIAVYYHGCPAYAGMDPMCDTDIRITTGLPRLRGDGPVQSANDIYSQLVAPPTRGWTLNRLLERTGRHGCPAYAGMDPKVMLAKKVKIRLPRLRGDGPQCLKMARVLDVVAPPTRGWTPVDQLKAFNSLGCPAYAGMDPVVTDDDGVTSGLPRLRGDGPILGIKEVAFRGVAPPTRGWTPNRARGRPK